MKRTFFAYATALTLGAGNPALAQNTDHNMHEAYGDHAAHGQDKAITQSTHQGHDMVADHDMASQGGAAEGEPPKKAVDPNAFVGPAYAADLFHDPAEMAKVRTNVIRGHGQMMIAKFMLDRLEAHLGNGSDSYAWEADAWIGQDVDKLWLKSEGEGGFNEGAEHAEVQALWSHAINPWFDLQIGVRQDISPEPQRTHGVIAIQGLAPYWFELSGELFLSNKGEATARAEAEYDLRITNRIILQPRFELNLSAQKAPEIGLGRGLTDASLGLRLRYEFTPQFAPYIGAQWEERFGASKRYVRMAGDDPSRLKLVLGTRFWF